MSVQYEFLLKRKEELKQQIEPLKALEAELTKVELLLETLDRSNNSGRWETPVHPLGCRCSTFCDPSR